MRAVIKYPGSKWALSNWIISQFPEHHSYLEPFFGSGAVLFNKPRSDIETVNDLDGNVVNLFRCIQQDPQKLARKIYYTPYSRDTYEKAFSECPKEPFEKALNFYIRCNMGHGFRTIGEKVGWKIDVQGREKAYAAMDWCKLPEKVMQAAERLRGVQIENSPAIDVIQRFNFKNVLIYCDPPYMLQTRHGKQYKCEMSNDEHMELLVVLLKHKGPVVISGYDTDLYNNMLEGWSKLEAVSYSQACMKRKEVIWMSFETNKQMNLFDFIGE
ncbi:MAG: DNA adenine methylase [Lachnospiraceae bacterium]|nr:DNA adenine methylase [Lachnospiraceae bacterium]